MCVGYIKWIFYTQNTWSKNSTPTPTLPRKWHTLFSFFIWMGGMEYIRRVRVLVIQMIEDPWESGEGRPSIQEQMSKSFALHRRATADSRKLQGGKDWCVLTWKHWINLFGFSLQLWLGTFKWTKARDLYFTIFRAAPRSSSTAWKAKVKRQR